MRGVTYGTFRPDIDGNLYKSREVVEADFIQMAQSNINTIRTYTVPPHWLLDLANKYKFQVIVGLPWEQHVTFLDRRAQRDLIVARVREFVRECAEHPAVLAFTVGKRNSLSDCSLVWTPKN